MKQNSAVIISIITVTILAVAAGMLLQNQINPTGLILFGPTGGLAAYWNFDEVSGSSAADYFGVNNGTLPASGVSWVTGKYSNAASFDGVNGFIAIPTNNSIGITGAGTISAWVKPRMNAWQGIIAKGNVNDNGQSYNYGLELDNAGHAICFIGNGALVNAVTSTAIIGTSSFTHLACTWDGATLRVYVNGNSNASVTQTITPAANSSPLYIGQFGGNVDRMNGLIDDVRIYSRALSAAEVRTLNDYVPSIEQVRLYVFVQGEGTVTASQQLSNCSTTTSPGYLVCDANLTPGTQITLTESHTSASQFLGWSVSSIDGNRIDCSTAPTCTFTVNSQTMALASFLSISPGRSATIQKFTSSSSSVTYNNSVILSWISKQSSSCAINGGNFANKSVPTYGTIDSGALIAPAVFTLTCNGGTGSTPATKSISVNVTNIPPSINLLLNPSSITSGQSSTLTWSSTNATSCTGTNFSTSNATSGSVNVSPTTTTNYSITCRSSEGVSASKSATLTVTPPPTISVTASDSIAGESPPNTGAFTITRTGATTNPLIVNFSINGSATSGNDYTALGGSATILAGDLNVIVIVTPIDDALLEGNENVTLTITPDSNYTVGLSNNALVTIADNETSVPNVPPVVSLTANPTAATAPAIITLAASASDSDGSVTRVDFNNGNTIIYSDTTAPYSYSWGGVPVGTYALTATAFDNAGATTTSSVVSATVSSSGTGIDCDQTTLQNAINNAAAGSTITCKAGTWTWSSGVTIPKSIVLRGAGITSGSNLTKIIRGNSYNGSLINIAPSSDVPVRVSGIYFDNVRQGAGDLVAVRINGPSGQGWGLTKIRVDHCKFEYGQRPIWAAGWAYGVIDHSEFLNNYIMIYLDSDSTNSWNRPITAGTANALFIEDNKFVINNSFYTTATDGWIYHFEGARSVIRNNVFDATAYTGDTQFYDSHGNQQYFGQGDSSRGQPIIEVYNNDFKAYKGYRGMYIRSGSTLIHDNNFTYTSSGTPTIHLAEEEAWTHPDGIFAYNPRPQWPAEDQITNTFIWNNKINGRNLVSSDITPSWGTGRDNSSFVQENREFFMHAPQATGGKEYYTGRAGASGSSPTVGTDTMVFTSTGANAYYPYAPYTYPHPLVTAQGN